MCGTAPKNKQRKRETMTSIQGMAQTAALKWLNNLASNHSSKGISLAEVDKRIAKGDTKGKETPFADFLKTNFAKLDTNNDQKLSLAELATAGKTAKNTPGLANKLASNALSLVTSAIS